MSAAVDAARRHLDDLANNRVAARDKPSALHHGLITELVAEIARLETQLSTWRARAEIERGKKK